MTKSRITRDTLLDNVRRVVVKVGSAVLATRDGLNGEAINRLADQLAELSDRGLDVVLVSSGAVAAGRQRIFERTRKKHRNGKDMVSRQAASAVGQGRLMHVYDRPSPGTARSRPRSC
jgi:glutamate 5-kinase